ncbi:sensor domain-containing diguanylate cyclase [Frankia sp. CiP3]|uniref:sensor domain-containing diguanylate cyclase n=1 Tax=Frankia sp. CiP3 TaxID=2880971 RepID=UPI001EF7159C|nr:sensor domain-containing diguanylate cyclase [Frankia sp. CiP3]
MTDDVASAVLDALPIAVAVLDSDGTVLRLNEAWRRGDATGTALVPVAPGGSWLAACAAASARLPYLDQLATITRQLLDNHRGRPHLEVHCPGPRGPRWLLVRLRPLMGGQGLVVLVDDITERRETEEKLRHHATHDTLTGLANRLAVTERLAELSSGFPAQPTEQTSGRDDLHPAALFFLDLDSLCTINNTFGYRIGDMVLRATAARLASALRPTDLLARWGGDEFVVVAGHLTSTDAAVLAEALTHSLAEPLAIGGHRITVSVNVGMALLDAATGSINQRRSGRSRSDEPLSPDAVELVELASETLVRSRTQRRHRPRPRL